VKGMGLAPGMLAADYLWRKNRVDWIIDTDKINEELISDYIGWGDGIIKYLSLAKEEDRPELVRLLEREQYNTIILLTSDYYLREIGAIIEEISPSSKLAVSNNFHICCGEGICGSCSAVDSNGETYKMCKCQNHKNNINNLFDTAW
ncbi:MAG: hypothetical protein PHR60_08285, partial [Eubacteriales bacterium]|nr:hypothetical protein [Eubacteriales bacterium]